MLDQATNQTPESEQPERPRQVLAVIRGGVAGGSLRDYALSVAERLGLGVLAAYVDTLPRFGDRMSRRERFAAGVAADAARFREQAKERGIGFECLTASGKASEAVLAVVRGGRRVEFVVLDPAIGIDEVARHSPVPVFGLHVADEAGARNRDRRLLQQRNPGRLTMSERTRKRNVARTVIFGAGAVALYAAVFTHADAFAALSSKGGFYAVVPVITVFLFSYIHGSFTGAFWSALGIEASKKAGATKPATVGAAKRKDTRAAARVNA